MSLVLALMGALRSELRTRIDLTLENLALRQQLALLRPLMQADVPSAAIWSALGQRMSSRPRVRANSDGPNHRKLLDPPPSPWYGLQTCDPRVPARAQKHAALQTKYL